MGFKKIFLLTYRIEDMKMFCKHEWKILSETTTKSRIEVMSEVLNSMSKISGLYDPVSRKFIQIVYCVKCGKLKRFVEEI